MLLGVLSQESTRHDELVTRMERLDESMSELKAIVEAAAVSIRKLGMASIASSAMLKDDGKSPDEIANRQILDHVEEALKVAPGLLKHHNT